MSGDAPVPPLLTVEGRIAAPSLTRAMRQPFDFWPKELLTRDAVRFDDGKRRFVIIGSRDLIDTILRDRDSQYPRAQIQKRFLSQLYGDDLRRGDVEFFDDRRRKLARPISPRQSEAAMPAFDEACDILVARWQRAGPDHAPDLILETTRLVLDGFWRAFLRDQGDRTAPPPEVDQTAHALAETHVEGRKQQIEALAPMAALAMSSQGPVKRDMEERGILDAEMMALFIDTASANTSAALQIILWLVASRPDLQEAIRSEVGAAPGKTAEAVVLEALRLVPPIMQMWRDIGSDIEADGETIPGGFTAILSLYALHRHHDCWSHPNLFRPERFLDPQSARNSRLNMLPFGLGPRGCIGQSLAMLQLTRALTRICCAFDLRPNPQAKITITTIWDARMTTPDPVLVTARK